MISCRWRWVNWRKIHLSKHITVLQSERESLTFIWLSLELYLICLVYLRLGTRKPFWREFDWRESLLTLLDLVWLGFDEVGLMWVYWAVRYLDQPQKRALLSGEERCVKVSALSSNHLVLWGRKGKMPPSPHTSSPPPSHFTVDWISGQLSRVSVG